MKVFTAQQMRDFDRAAIEEYGIPSIVLMENAALRVVEFLEAKFAPLAGKTVLILCGKGNNGGDGFCIARHLANAYCEVGVVLAASPNELRGDALVAYQMYMSTTDPEDHVTPFPEVIELSGKGSFNKEVGLWAHHYDILIDALLGTGFQGAIRDNRIAQALGLIEDEGAAFERWRRTDIGGKKRFKIAVDIPSGLNADTGEAAQNRGNYDFSDSIENTKRDLAAAQGHPEYAKMEHFRRPRMDYTLTFVAPKAGMLVRDGLKACGEIWVGDIGVRDRLLSYTTTKRGCISYRDAQSLLSPRSIDAHKGDAGRALIIGGSFGMSGALALACRAALNAGCGLCIAAMPERVLPIFAASILEATSHPLPCDESGKLLERAADELPELWRGVQVVAIGPGISRSEGAQAFAARVVRECPLPLIIDADALHALPSIAEDVRNREADTILTPHPGEMGALMGISAGEVNDSRFEIVAACAAKYGAIVVLKGARSLVATPDGQIFVNLTGNAGMATGGSGDVLTGTIAGLLAQLKNSEDATKLGVYLHGFAGDLAFGEKGNGLVAGDIAANLGRALVEIPKREVERINGRLRKLM